jgi:hypothetical protein
LALCLLVHRSLIVYSRMHLETDSNQDLFVLRNVVMSPFQGAGKYVDEIASIFKGVLEEEVRVSAPYCGFTIVLIALDL